jgi:inorganic pyrophosphatase
MNYLKLPIGARTPEVVNAVVEIPRGGSNKYEYDRELQVFRLDRALHSSVYYPCEYGFIPGTLGEDGDALDIMVLTGRPTFTGCLLEARPVGLLKMVDGGDADWKVLAVGLNDPEHAHIKTHSDVYPHVLREIEHFFAIYKQLEGKETKVEGWREMKEAHKVIVAGKERFLEREK